MEITLDFVIFWTEAEVINTSIEDTNISLSGHPNSNSESEESSGASSEVTESESCDMEIQSPKVVLRGSAICLVSVKFVCVLPANNISRALCL